MKYLLPLISLLHCWLASALTLDETIRSTLSTHPDLLAERERASAAENDRLAVWLRLLPSLQASGSSDWSESENEFKFKRSSLGGGLGGGFGFPSSRGHGLSYSYGFTLPLFDGFETYFLARAAKAQLQSVEFNLSTKQNSLAVRAAQVYLSLAARKMTIEFLQNLTTEGCFYDQLLQTNLSGTDRSRIELHKQSVVDDLKDIVATLGESLATFLEVTSIEQPDISTFENIGDILARISLPSDYQEALSIAEQYSPELGRARTSIDRAENNRRAQIGRAFSPKLNLFGSQSHSESDTNNSESENDNSIIGVRLSWSFQPDSVASQIARSHEVQAAQYDFSGTARRLLTSISSSYEKIMRLANSYNRHGDILKQAEESVRQQMEQIKPGEKFEDVGGALSIFDFYRQAFSDSVDALTDYVLAEIQVLGTMGVLANQVIAAETHEKVEPTFKNVNHAMVDKAEVQPDSTSKPKAKRSSQFNKKARPSDQSTGPAKKPYQLPTDLTKQIWSLKL